jgi:hypothetical protein
MNRVLMWEAKFFERCIVYDWREGMRNVVAKDKKVEFRGLAYSVYAAMAVS